MYRQLAGSCISINFVLRLSVCLCQDGEVDNVKKFLDSGSALVFGVYYNSFFII